MHTQIREQRQRCNGCWSLLFPGFFLVVATRSEGRRVNSGTSVSGPSSSWNCVQSQLGSRYCRLNTILGLVLSSPVSVFVTCRKVFNTRIQENGGKPERDGQVWFTLKS